MQWKRERGTQKKEEGDGREGDRHILLYQHKTRASPMTSAPPAPASATNHNVGALRVQSQDFEERPLGLSSLRQVSPLAVNGQKRLREVVEVEVEGGGAVGSADEADAARGPRPLPPAGAPRHT